MTVSRRGLFGLAAGAAVAGLPVVVAAEVLARNPSPALNMSHPKLLAAQRQYNLARSMTCQDLADMDEKVWIEWARNAVQRGRFA